MVRKSSAYFLERKKRLVQQQQQLDRPCKKRVFLHIKRRYKSSDDSIQEANNILTAPQTFSSLPILKWSFAQYFGEYMKHHYWFHSRLRHLFVQYQQQQDSAAFDTTDLICYDWSLVQITSSCTLVPFKTPLSILLPLVYAPMGIYRERGSWKIKIAIVSPVCLLQPSWLPHATHDSCHNQTQIPFVYSCKNDNEYDTCSLFQRVNDDDNSWGFDTQKQDDESATTTFSMYTSTTITATIRRIQQELVAWERDMYTLDFALYVALTRQLIQHQVFTLGSRVHSLWRIEPLHETKNTILSRLWSSVPVVQQPTVIRPVDCREKLVLHMTLDVSQQASIFEDAITKKRLSMDALIGKKMALRGHLVAHHTLCTHDGWYTKFCIQQASVFLLEKEVVNCS